MSEAWSCSQCTFNNCVNIHKCSICNSLRPSTKYGSSFASHQITKNRKRSRQTFEKTSIEQELISMGFNGEISEKAASYYPNDKTKAIEYILGTNNSTKDEILAKQLQIMDDEKLAQQIQSSKPTYNPYKYDTEPPFKKQKLCNNINYKQHPTIKGLYLIPNFVNKEEQKDVLAAAKNIIDKQFISYANNGDSRLYICHRLARRITKVLQDIGLIYSTKKNIFDNILLRNYKKGDKLAMHIDDAVRYGNIIGGISFGSTSQIVFRKNGTKKNEKVRLEVGDLFLMTGEARYKYMHGFGSGDIFGDRTSLTFRWNTGTFVDNVPVNQSARSRC
eukprot:323321_1